MILDAIISILKFLGPLGKPFANWLEDRRRAKYANMRQELLDLKMQRAKLIEEIRDATGEVHESLFEDFYDISNRIAYLSQLLKKN